jgi:hypothetical protein
MKEHGVSLVEMMSVLLILGSVSGVIISRVASVDEMELAAKVNSIRNHIRYTQIMAMKRNDMTWGIKCDGTDYWVFKTATPEVAGEPDDTNNMVYLPGHENQVTNNPAIAMPEMGDFTLYFDKFGIPYEYDNIASNIKPRDSGLSIPIGSKTLTVKEVTGFVE